MEIALDKKDSSILLPIPYLHPLFHSHKNNCLQISDLKKRQQRVTPEGTKNKILPAFWYHE